MYDEFWEIIEGGGCVEYEAYYGGEKQVFQNCQYVTSILWFNQQVAVLTFSSQFYTNISRIYKM